MEVPDLRYDVASLNVFNWLLLSSLSISICFPPVSCWPINGTFVKEPFAMNLKG